MFERAGLATVGISLHHNHTRQIRPPRALLCHFPLGRPLGRPADAPYQRRVLDAAFDLLDADAAPAIAEFPEAIHDEVAEPLACPLPPRVDPDAPPAVDEARGLRPAWERSHEARGATQVGRAIDADGVPIALGVFAGIAAGTPWTDAGSADALAQTAMDIRVYYEEAALALVGHVPAARSAETWFYRHTEAGQLLRKVLGVLQTADPPFPALGYLVPLSQR